MKTRTTTGLAVRLLIPALLALTLTSPSRAWAQQPPTPPEPPKPLVIDGNTEVPAYHLVRLSVSGPALDDVTWDVLYANDIGEAIDGLRVGTAGYVFAGPPGRYRVKAFAISGGKLSQAIATVTIQGPPGPTPPGPTPPGPNPPGPTPPTPPGPTPPVPPQPPSPLPDKGLRVLMVYESSDLSKYPRDQMLALYDTGLRDYLSSVTAKSAVGQPEWRVYDKDTDVSKEAPVWQAAMSRPHPTLPWILISNGTTGYEGPLPKDATETKVLVQKYVEVKP